MAGSVLKNKICEFNSKIKQQVSGAAVRTKFARLYACYFMDKFETSFLEKQQLQPLVWVRCIDDTFFIWMYAEEALNILKFLMNLIPALSLPMSSTKNISLFLI